MSEKIRILTTLEWKITTYNDNVMDFSGTIKQNHKDESAIDMTYLCHTCNGRATMCGCENGLITETMDSDSIVSTIYKFYPNLG